MTVMSKLILRLVPEVTKIMPMVTFVMEYLSRPVMTLTHWKIALLRVPRKLKDDQQEQKHTLKMSKIKF